MSRILYVPFPQPKPIDMSKQFDRPIFGHTFNGREIVPILNEGWEIIPVPNEEKL